MKIGHTVDFQDQYGRTKSAIVTKVVDGKTMNLSVKRTRGTQEFLHVTRKYNKMRKRIPFWTPRPEKDMTPQDEDLKKPITETFSSKDNN